MHHPIYYYFRRIRPWTRVSAGDDAAVARELDSPAPQPALVADGRMPRALPAGVITERLGDIRLLLPPAYVACAEMADRTAPIR